MEREIFTCDQGSPEWYEARRGIPTASMFSTVMASGKGGSESKGRRTYMLKLAGEILTGEPMENYSNDDMERGKAMEEEARTQYAFQNDADLEQVGFIRATSRIGRAGCSPDSLIGPDGMVEIKTTKPHLLIDIHLRGEFPPEHKAQCQGNLWVSDRKWIDIAIYWPKMPLYIQRVRRDEAYIIALERAVADFNAELAYVVTQMRKLS